ncbi:helix-turn-helix domain-containing protein [Pseudomonas syringae group genomosp. 7]
MHRAYYSKIERGEKNLTLATLERVAKGMGTSMSAQLRAAGL